MATMEQHPYRKRFLQFAGLLTVLVLLAQFAIHFYLARHSHDGAKVNLAARQRTLAESMSKDVLILKLAEPERRWQQKDVIDDLALLFQKWENTHRALLFGESSYQIDGRNSEKTIAFFKELEPSYTAMYHSLKTILEKPQDDVFNAETQNILQAEDEFLRVMNLITFQYSKEADALVAWLRRLELILAAFLITSLILGFRLIIRPVLNRMQRQNAELVLLNEELKKAGEHKANFIANVSHEIQSPMHGIIGMSQLLLQSDLNSEQRNNADTLRKSADTLMSMLGDILDYGRIEAGEMMLNPEVFRLESIIDEVYDMLKPLTIDKNIELTRYVATQVPDLIIQDPVRLRQIIFHLIGNAIKFTERGEVELKVDYLNEESGMVLLKFTVRDTGIGLEADEKQRIFESFSQVDSSSAKTFSGTGIGLSICKHLVGLMNGQIWVDSKKGKGSTFYFTIVAEKASENSEIAPSFSTIEGKRAMVVDDNKTNLKILVRLLANWGVQATPFNSPDLVADILGSLNKFDFCIVDLMMPGIDGKTLARRIRESYPKGELPVIVLVPQGHSMLDDKESLFDAVVSKPVKQDKLLAAINRLMQVDDSVSAKKRMIAAKPAFSGLNVLIAEDNPLHQAVAERTMKKLGFHTEHASTTEEILHRIRQGKVDLVMLDPKINEIDTSELIARLRDIEPDEAKRPVLFGIKDQANTSAQTNALLDDFVNAPFDADELSVKMYEWFSED